MATDMTTGNPTKILWKFSIPMLVSVMFQQLYNIADSVIAGKYAGEAALAAVGASYPITMIFMAVAVGTNIGCSVIVSQLFGAKKLGRMKTAVTTTFCACFVMSVVLTLVGLLFSRNMMQLVNTPMDIMEDGNLYLKIYIAGLIFLFFYNVCTGIFTALGDSKTPLYFLILSSIGNIVLDLLFVAVFKWGVAGVAWATFIAQGISSVLAFIVLIKRLNEMKIEEKSVFFDLKMLGKVSIVAVPSILQQSFISIGNMFIQSLVNGYGPSVIAGYSAAIKLNTFAITSFTTLANGLSSFAAQNIGAGKYDRVKKGYKSALFMAIVVVTPFFLLYFIGSTFMMGIFVDAQEGKGAILAGVKFLTIVTPFYYMVVLKLMSDGVLRGAGAMGCFMVTTFTDLILRVILAYVFSVAMGMGEAGIWKSWPYGWSISAILSIIFYLSGKWKPKENNFK